ncbi:MAG: hypothetical protein J6D34_02455, partial [Atopobiaceae bacterium]|nr:hypothetical protein [Atopobiaceae bacterium]
MHDDHRATTLSRRGFFKAAAGSLASVSYMVFRSPTVAVAEEGTVYYSEADGGKIAEEQLNEIIKEADIYIANRHQCCVYVGDLAKSAGANPIAGAMVTLTSRYNNVSITTTTEDNGIAVFDISTMAENPDNMPVDQLETYQFNGTITVEKAGYREFEAGRMYIEGPSTIVVDTRALSEKPTPYPRKVSLDEWDILYSADDASTFYVNDDMTDTNPCVVQWRSLWSDDPATVELIEAGSERIVTSTTATPINGALDVSMEEQFLLQGGDHGLNVDGAYKVRITQGNNVAEVDLHASVTQGQAKKSEEEKPDTYCQPFNNLNTNTMGFGNWPDGVPIVGNTPIFSYIPDFYVNCCFNPFGYLQFTAKTPSWGYHTDNGKDESTKGLHFWPLKTVGQQFDKACDKIDKMKKKASTTRTQPGKVRQINFSQAFHADVTAQLVLMAKWDSKKNYLQGQGAFQLFFNMGYSLTENFWAGPIPVLVGFSIDVSFNLTIGPSFKTDPVPGGTLIHDGADISKWKWDYDNTGVSLTLNITPALSIGIGVDGVASVSIKGRFTLTMYFGLFIVGAGAREMPHKIYGYSAQITLILQFLLFSHTFNIRNWPYKAFYDNWKGGMLSQAADPLSALADIPLAELLSQMQIVTDSMLEKTKEFDGKEKVTGQEEEEIEVHSWLDFCEDELVDEQLDDGRTISYYVIQLPGFDKEDGGLEQAGDQQPVEQEAEGQTAEQPSEEQPSEPIAEEGLAALAVEEGLSAMADGEDLAAMAEGEQSEAGEAQSVPPVGEQPQPATEEAVAASPTEPAPARPRLRRRASRIEYTPVDEGLFVQAESSLIIPEATIAQLGKQGGVKPSSDVKLNTRPVYGDPRIEVVDLLTVIDGTTVHATCCFRIGSASVNGKMRTRIIMTALDTYQEVDGQEVSLPQYAGRSHVIDFDISDWGFDHNELYDYDFGIAVTQHGDGSDSFQLVHLVVVSSRREQGDSTSFADAATNLVFTYFDFDSSVAFGTIDALTIAHSGSEIFGPNDGRYHSISNIRCPVDGSTDSTTLLISYLDRNAATPEGTLTDDASVVTTNVRFLLYNMVTRTITVPKHDMIDQVLGPIEHGAIFEMSISPQIGGAYTLTLVAHDQTIFFVMKFARGKFTSFKRAVDLPQKLRLVPWPQRDCFLCSYPEADYVQEMEAKNLWSDQDALDRGRWRLHTAVWTDGADGAPTLSFTPVGPDHFNFSTFALNGKGNFIFWQQAREGDDGRIYHDASGDAGTTETPNEDTPLYQVAASRIRGTDGIKFSDPFVVAEVAHDMDTLSMLDTRVSNAPVEMVTTQLVDTGDTAKDGSTLYHACDLWYTSVPQLRCVTAIGCEAHIPVGKPGSRMTFNVTLRNDGNTFIGGCHLQMFEHHPIIDKDGKVERDSEVAEVTGCALDLVFSADTLVDSAFTPYEDGKFINVEDDFALVPGKKAVYRVTVTIPEDWEGEKFISFVASDPIVVPDGTLNAMGEEYVEEAVEFAVEPGTYCVFPQAVNPDTDTKRTYMDSFTVGGSNLVYGGMADAPVRVWTNVPEGEDPVVPGGDPVVPGGGGGSNGGGGASGRTQTAKTGGSTSSKLPKMGDDSVPGPMAAG